MQDYIRERVLSVGNYILESRATVRQTATIFGVSKSTVHTVVTNRNAGLGSAQAQARRRRPETGRP